jgi:hypothetical protein
VQPPGGSRVSGPIKRLKQHWMATISGGGVLVPVDLPTFDGHSLLSSREQYDKKINIFKCVPYLPAYKALESNMAEK